MGKRKCKVYKTGEPGPPGHDEQKKKGVLAITSKLDRRLLNIVVWEEVLSKASPGVTIHTIYNIMGKA